MKLPYLSAIVISITVFLAGCKEPKDLEFKEIRNSKLGNIGFSKATLTGDVVLYNPNNFSLELSRMDLDIYVENTLFGHTSQTVQVKVPSRQEFTLPLTLDVDIKNLLKNGALSLMNKEVNIRALGSVKVGKMGVYKSFPVDYTTKQNISSYLK